jgi:pimeloyl-ACP methyl ester carboxylesterase
MESIFTAEKPIQISPVIKIFRFYFKNIGSFVPSLSSRLLWYLFTTPRPRTLRAIHTRLLKNSFKTDELIFEDLVLKVYHWGNPTGKKVLIVHGWESFAADHGRLIQELIKLGYHIIAPDMPAHGKSGGRQSHLPQFKTAALQIAQEFGPFHAVVGHSLGAVASTLMLCEYEKTEEVEKLISIGAAIDPIRFFAQFADFLALSDTLYHHFIQYSSRKINVDINAFDVHGIKDVLHPKEIIFIHDTNDEIIPIDEKRQFLKSWPQATLIETDHGGHFRNFKNVAVVKLVRDIIHKGARAKPYKIF